MARAHFNAAQPKCCGAQLVEKPVRLVGKRQAKIGNATPALIQKKQMIV